MSAGAVTLEFAIAAGGAGRIGSAETFGLATAKVEVSAGSGAGAAELASGVDARAGAEFVAEEVFESGAGFVSGDFVGRAEPAGFSAGVAAAGVAEEGVVGTMEAILSFSTRTKP